MKKLFRHLAIAIALGSLSAAALLGGEAQAALSADEASVKAGYIFNFMKFVDWPPQFQTQTVNVCVLGSNPFGRVLESLSGKPIRNRPIRVVTDVPLGQVRYCHVVFVSRSEAGRLTNALLRLRQTPILTVSDIEGFSDHGGVIELLTGTNGEVAFRVSQKSAEEVGLRVSSKLLSLSR